MRRNAGVVTATALIALSLVAGLFAFAWQARIARQRAAELEQVARFQSQMLAKVDSTRAGALLR